MGMRVLLLSVAAVVVAAGTAFWAGRENSRTPVTPGGDFPPSPASPGQAGVGVGISPPVVAPMGEAEKETIRAELRAELKAELERAAAGSAPAPSRPVREEPQSLSTEALLARLDGQARSPDWKRKEGLDVGAALRDAEALLARNLGAEDRAKALVDKAILHRVGPGADRVLEEEALREAARLQGEDTGTGREVRFQLAWTRSARGDDREAAELFDRVASHPDTEPGFRATNRWEAAFRADRLEDGERARLWYRAFVDENGSREGEWFTRTVARAKERLKALE